MKSFIPTAALAITSACTAATPTPVPSTPDLAGSEWGSADAPDVFLRFGADGMMTGSGGCNSIGGPYTQDEEALSFGPIRATRRACDISTMDREQDVLAALESTARLIIEADGRLMLEDASGATLLTLNRRD